MGIRDFLKTLFWIILLAACFMSAVGLILRIAVRPQKSNIIKVVFNDGDVDTISVSYKHTLHIENNNLVSGDADPHIIAQNVKYFSIIK